MHRPISFQWVDSLTGYEYAAESDGLSSRTIDNRRSAIRGLARWLDETYGITDPAKVQKVHLQAAMIRAHKERARSGPRTHFNDLRAFFTWLADDDGSDNPMDGLKRPPDVVVPVKVLTPKEIAAVRAAMSGRDWHSMRDTAIFLTLLETGVRRAELCNAAYGDLDLKARELVIRRGKGGKSRVVVLGSVSAAALWKLQKNHPTKKGALFTTRTGERLAECSVGAMLHRRGEKAGLPELRAHMLRHSWAHYTRANGMQDSDLQVLGGWESPVQLARYGAAEAQARALAAAKDRPVLGK